MSPITQLQVIGLAKESSYGTFVSATDYLPCTTADVTTSQKVVRPVRMDGIRGIRRDHRVGIETGFQLSADLYPMGFTKLIAGAMGTGSDSVTGSGSVGYTHVLTPQNGLPSYSLELASDDYTQLLSRQVPGCMVDTLTVKGASQSLVTLDATLMGQNEQTPATPGLPSFATPTGNYPNVEPMDFSQATVSYNALANTNLTDFAIGINNACQRVFTANGHLYLQRIVPTQRQVTLTANWDFVDLLQYTDWSGQAVANLRALVFTISGDIMSGTSNPYSLVFNIPRARVDQTFQLANKAEVLEANLTFSVTLGTNSSEMTVTIVNLEAGSLA